MTEYKIGDRVEFAADGDFQNYRENVSGHFYDVGTVVGAHEFDYGVIVRWDSNGEETCPSHECIRHLDPKCKKRPHRDLIIAWANGAEIQQKGISRWQDVKCPSWDEHAEFRIKPQEIKRKGWINIYPGMGVTSVALASGIFETKKVADEYADYDRLTCVEIEWLEELKG